MTPTPPNGISSPASAWTPGYSPNPRSPPGPGLRTPASHSPPPSVGSLLPSSVPAPSSSVSGQAKARTFHGLPDLVRVLIAQHRHVTELYDWQREVLESSALRSGRSFVYSLPTSGGKTLVAEIVLLQVSNLTL